MKISVIIPAYNAADTIASTVKSALDQTRPPDEIVIVDDGATDDTAAIVAELEGPINYVRQENRGPGAARNRGIAEAAGDILAFLDADDLWTPDKLERQNTVLEKNARVSLVFTNMIDQFEDGSLFADPHVAIDDCAVGECSYTMGDNNTRVFDGHITSALLLRNVIHTPTVVARRRTLENTGGFDESLRFMEDLDLWFEIARTGRVAYIDEICCYRRLHRGNVTRDRASADTTQIQVLSRWLQRTDVEWLDNHRERLRKRLAILTASCGRRMVKDGNVKEGRQYLKKSLHYAPRLKTAMHAAWSYLR